MGGRSFRTVPYCLAVLFVMPLQAEIIGAYDISHAPVSASLISGAGGGWLDVVNVPVTVSQAFSGFSVIDDGMANCSSGTVFEMVFAPGALVNGPGPDLVVFDGRFSQNSYRWSSSADGFANAQPLPAASFVDTGLLRSYFYVGGGPFQARVMALPVDLSNIGAPAWAAVAAVRLQCTSAEADPLGIGALRRAAEPVIPEPSTLALVGLGVLAMRRRRHR